MTNTFDLPNPVPMKSNLLAALLLTLTTWLPAQNAVLVEAESFSERGGWVIDQQSMDVMGSPYLMAHGMGIPVADAKTTVSFPEKGKYQV